jgi:hypothetical protein
MQVACLAVILLHGVMTPAKWETIRQELLPLVGPHPLPTLREIKSQSAKMRSFLVRAKTEMADFLHLGETLLDPQVKKNINITYKRPVIRKFLGLQNLDP